MFSTKKEPEINPLKTGSMAVWNTGDATQQKPQATQKVVPLNKEQALKGIVRRYQEAQYYNYMQFIGDLGSLGYCIEPLKTSEIYEVTPSEYVSEEGTIRSKTSYGEYRRNKEILESHKRQSESNGNDGNSSKKQKVDDGWGDDEGTSKNNDTQRLDSTQSSGWGDDSNKRNGSKFNYKSANDSNDNRERFGNNRERFGNNRGRGSGFRGGRGGRGRYDNNNSQRNNDRYANKSAISEASSGWSDDEDSSKNKRSSDSWNDKKTEETKSTSDGWDDDQSNASATKSQATPAPSNDDWD